MTLISSSTHSQNNIDNFAILFRSTFAGRNWKALPNLYAADNLPKEIFKNISQNLSAPKTTSNAPSNNGLPNNTSSEPKELKNWGHAVNGAVSMAVGLLPTHPFFTIKNNVMLGIPQKAYQQYRLSTPKTSGTIAYTMGFIRQSWNVHAKQCKQKRQSPTIGLGRRLWAGYGANAGSGAPAEAIAFATYAFTIKCIPEHKLPPKGSVKEMEMNLGISILSGSIGSPINASLEQVMIRQQIQGGSFYSHIVSIWHTGGPKAMFKGTAVTAGRDAIFNCGVFALNDYVKAIVHPALPNHPLARDTVSGMVAGMIAGAISTPLDLGKTIYQEDTTGTYLNFRHVMKDIIKKEGLLGIFNGAMARALTIGPLICLTAVLKDRHTIWAPSWLYQSSNASSAVSKKPEM